MNEETNYSTHYSLKAFGKRRINLVSCTIKVGISILGSAQQGRFGPNVSVQTIATPA